MERQTPSARQRADFSGADAPRGLIECMSCGQNVSPQATSCPRCGGPVSAGQQSALYADCRGCGKPLLITAHVKEVANSYISNGNTTWDRRRTHYNPCANCGHPQPVSSLKLIKFQHWVQLVCLIVVTVIAFYWLFHST